jgi:hypothetical protein
LKETYSEERINFLKAMSSYFKLTHAKIVGVNEEKIGLYQCQVLPDLEDIDDLEGLPWFPSLSPGKRDYQVGEFVWVYVSEDFWIGYVLDRLNTESQLFDKHSDIFKKIQDTLKSVETEIQRDINYETCGFVPLSPPLYLVWEGGKQFASIVNIESKTVIALSGDKVFVQGTEIHFPQKVKIGEGDSAVARALELQDILDEVENHIHISPVGPVDAAKGSDRAPLSSKIAKMRQTMESTNLFTK